MVFELIYSVVVTFGLSIVIAFSLWVIGYVGEIFSKEFGKTMTEEAREKLILNKKMIGVFVVGVYSIVAVLLTFSLLTGIHYKNETENDIANWATLVIEVGLGASVAVVLFMYSHHGQKRIEQVNTKRLTKAKKGIAFGLNNLKEHLENVKIGIHQSYTQGITIPMKPWTGFSDLEKNKANYIVNNIIVYHCTNAHHLLDDDLEQEVRGACAELPEVYHHIGSEVDEIKQCQEIIDLIDYIKMEYLEGY